ncbi:MAG: hypothetical protein KatS3mg103_0026 [Phycisphaerales bacterium]|nr:MAG: hypothetical protein KatS3mg103_0026 [Phycisphaerales bacterium]
MPSIEPSNPARITLYGPSAVGVGLGVSLVGCAAGAALGALAGDGLRSAQSGVVAGGLLASGWLAAWVFSAVTGPYQPATAGMAWLAISSARLMILVLGALALAVLAPTMGLGLWLAVLLGGLASVLADSMLALSALRRHAGGHRTGSARLTTLGGSC